MARKYRARVGWRQQLSLAVSPAPAAWSGQSVGLTYDSGEPSTFDYYISPTGSNDNDGLTTDTPWAISALSGSTKSIANKRIGLLSGNYVLTTTYPRGDGGRYFINLTQGGTAETPLVIESVVPRGAVITNKSGGVYVSDNINGGSIFLGYDGASHVHFKGLRLFEVIGGISMAASNILVEDCAFEDIDTMAGGGTSNDNANAVGAWKSFSSTSYASNWIVRNCKFDGIYNTGTKQYWSNSVAVGHYGLDNLIVEDCTISRTGGVLYTKDNCGAFTIRRCFIYNTAAGFRAPWTGGGTNTSLVPSRRNEIHNNVIYPKQNSAHNHARGMFYGDEHYSWIQNTDCYNNTLYQDQHSGSGGHLRMRLGSAAGKQYGTDTKMWNNIFYRVGGSRDLSFAANTPFSDVALSYKTAISLMNYNAYSSAQAFAAEDEVAGSGSMTFAQWQADNDFDANSLVTNPLFVTPGGTTAASFQLDTGSPCIGAGRVGGTSGGDAVDMGAWGGATPPTTIGCDF
jgi:hypothetical protein